MAQIILNVEDVSILPHLKKILNALNGVSIVKSPRISRKSGSLDEAMEDIKNGRINHYESAEDLFKSLGI